MDTVNPFKNNIKAINEHYGLEDEDISHPTNYETIIQNQQKIKNLSESYRITKIFLHKIHSFICKNRKIVIHKQLGKQVAE